MTLGWIGDNGFQATFDGSDGITVLAGSLGIEAPPVSLFTSAMVSADGSVINKARKPARRVVLPLLFSNDEIDVRPLVAELLRSMVIGGILRYDGTNTRDLYGVRYESGAEQSASGLNPGNQTDDVYVISLLALDPWWQDAQQAEEIDTGSIPFDDASTSFDDIVDFDGRTETTITVNGDAPALPVWTIDGPYSKLTVGSQGGQSFTLSAPLADGSQLVLDTRPGNRGPRLDGGPIDWSLLTPESRLWELPVGSPIVVAGAAGDDGGSAVSVAFRQRWLTP